MITIHCERKQQMSPVLLFKKGSSSLTMAIADPVADLVLLGVAAFLAPVTSLLPLPSRLRLSRHFCSRFNLFCKSSQNKFNAGEAAELWGCFTWSRGLYCQVLCLAGGEIQFGLGGASNSLLYRPAGRLLLQLQTWRGGGAAWKQTRGLQHCHGGLM